MNIFLQDLSHILSGRILSGQAGLVLSGEINTDSRKNVPGSLFFALSGENFDGNDFAKSAAEKGAAAVIISRPIDGLPAQCGAILVEDTLQALQTLAQWWREQLTGLQVIAITGSNGKTSTKDFTKAVLSEKFATIATQGNLNNHIGVPLSILSVKKSDEVAVWEMGMNHKGELAPLCKMTAPRIGIITNIGTAHIEFMGTRDAIAEEKATLARALPEEGTLIYQSSDDYAGYLEKNTKAHLLTTGKEGDLVFARNIIQTEKGSRFDLVAANQSAPVELSVPGRHMIGNALLAAGAGYTLGMTAQEIAAGLNKASLSHGRLRQFAYKEYTIIDDTYNANPDSMVAALDTLATLNIPSGAKRIAVLGKMGELGDHSDEGHARVGSHAVEQGIDILLVIGDEAREIANAAASLAPENTEVFLLEKEEAASTLTALLSDGDAILFKGSRSAAIEDILNTAFPPLQP